MKKTIAILLGVIISVLILEVGVRFLGFAFTAYQNYRNGVSLSKKGAYRILCLGDSVTAVEGAGGQHAYPGQLEELLNKAVLSTPITVINKGVIGANSMSVLGALEKNIETYKPDIVVSMIGINDFNIRYYEDLRISYPMLFNNFRLYKLFALLWREILIRRQQMIRNQTVETSKYKNIEEGLSKTISERKGVGAIAEKNAWEMLIIDPRDDKAYVELCRIYIFYYNQLENAEYFLNKALRINPNCDMAYALRGYILIRQGDLSDAEASGLKALQINSRNDFAHVVLGMVRRNKGESQSAKAYYQKAIELNGKSDFALAMVGWLYRDEMNFSVAEEYFKKAIHLNPDNDFARAFLGWIYMMTGREKDAEVELLSAIKINPYNEIAYERLGRIYRERNSYDLAERYFKKLIEINPNNNRAYWDLVGLYEAMGKLELAKVYRQKASNTYCTPVMRKNYLAIQALLRKYNITWVCMQYPLKSVQLLRDIFVDRGGIIFVDNEKNFKEAIERSSARDYFVDMFAGDFGHCSFKGHRLIAENLARHIRKEIFRK